MAGADEHAVKRKSNEDRDNLVVRSGPVEFSQTMRLFAVVGCPPQTQTSAIDNRLVSTGDWNVADGLVHADQVPAGKHLEALDL